MSLTVARDVRSPIAAYLGDLLERHAATDARRGRDLHPRARSASTPTSSASASPPSTAPSTRPATRAHPFTIQSMSKPLTYGLALELAGRRRCTPRVGVEPSGDPFNEISLHPATGHAAEPDDQRRRDHLRRARARGGAATRSSAAPRRTPPTPAGRSSSTTAVYRSEARHRPPEPRDRPPAAQLRRPRPATRRPRSTSTSASARSRSTAATSR